MIGKDEIAEACRNLDALIEERGDFLGFWRERDVDGEGLVYIAEQRALRAAMILDGQDPNPGAEFVQVNLPEHLRDLLPSFAALFIDGFAAAQRIERANR